MFKSAFIIALLCVFTNVAFALETNIYCGLSVDSQRNSQLDPETTLNAYTDAGWQWVKTCYPSKPHDPTVIIESPTGKFMALVFTNKSSRNCPVQGRAFCPRNYIAIKSHGSCALCANGQVYALTIKGAPVYGPSTHTNDVESVYFEHVGRKDCR